MGEKGIPVVDEAGRVAGVISEKDFLRRMGVTGPQNFMALVASCLKSKGCVALPIKKQKAADLMSAPAVTVSPETSLKDIAAIFAARKINRAPVTDAGGRLLGIVTRGDLVKATGGEKVHNLGYLFVGLPVGAGVLLLLLIALLVNNLSLRRRYPEFWF
jgi:CBS-domain-containing membrane protein